METFIRQTLELNTGGGEGEGEDEAPVMMEGKGQDGEEWVGQERGRVQGRWIGKEEMAKGGGKEIDTETEIEFREWDERRRFGRR